jgi:hypothetical protein
MVRLLDWSTRNALETPTFSSFSSVIQALAAYDVSRMATGGDGTTGNPWVGWEGTLNALPTFTRIHFPAGVYRQVSIVTMKQGWTISGAGRGGDATTGAVSRVTGTMAGTGFRTNEVIGAGGIALDIHITGLMIENTNAANVGSGILLVGGYHVDIDHVTVQGFKFGITDVGCSRVSITNYQLSQQLKIGFWLSDGSDYTLTYADIDLHGLSGGGVGFPGAFTGDDIALRDGYTNHDPGATAMVLESNYGVVIDQVKFNGGDYHIWCMAMNGLQIAHGTMEASANHNVRIATSHYLSGVAAGYSQAVTFGPGWQVSPQAASKNALFIDSAQTVVVTGNTFSMANGMPVIGNAAFCTNLVTINNKSEFATAMTNGTPSAGYAYINNLATTTESGKGYSQFSSLGVSRVISTETSIPTVSGATGIGSTGTASVGVGSSDAMGNIRLLPSGVGIASSGTLTFTVAGAVAYGPGALVMICMPNSPNGAANPWNVRATVTSTTGATATTSITITWDNNGVALTSGAQYNIHYICFAR